MANPFPGRRESVGLAKETTPGTSAAPTNWVPHLSITLDQKTDQIDNTSALGRLEDINDSAVVGQRAEGSLNSKVLDQSVGLLLMNLFGTCSPATHSGETIVFDNTFTVNNSTLPPSLTVTRVNPVVTRRYAMIYQTDFELNVKQKDWATVTSSLIGKVGASGSDTASYPTTPENEFTSKHTTVKIATNVAGLAGATALDVKSVKLKISRKVDIWIPFGGIDPTNFDLNEWSVTGEFVLRYQDTTTVEAIALANTRQALSITLKNTDATIGSTTNPSLAFTAPKVRLTPITLDNNLNQPLSQSVAFTCELDVNAGYMLQAVLVNLKNGY